MLAAPTILEHLEKRHINYDVLEHPRSATSLESARISKISPAQMAKAVVVKSGNNFRVCVIPAAHRLVLDWLNEAYGGHFHLIHENELQEIFTDCDSGAVPILGQLYGLPVVWDKKLAEMDDVYFEGGDHRHLVHLTHSAFMELLGLQDRKNISCTPESYEFYQRLH